MLATLILLQAVAGPVLPLPARPRVSAPCPVIATDDVVVCARSNEPFRLRPLPDRPERDGPPRAAIRLGNTSLAAEVEQATLAGDVPSRRAMLRLRLPFGRGKR